MKLTDYTRYDDAQRHFSMDAVWALFNGNRDALNIAQECIDRHAGTGRTAVRVAHADGGDEILSFDDISAGSAQVAHWLNARGVRPGDRVAIMLEPSRAYYFALFGAIKHGAIAVPLFTLFGPDGLILRVGDCTPRLLITNAEKLSMARGIAGPEVVLDSDMLAALPASATEFPIITRADDMAVYQYTSGTTRALPEAVKHTHRAVVLVMLAALYGTGVRPGDDFFCPSSPAWGHGLWHGTLAPLALGVSIGAYAGKFDPVRLLQALQAYGTTNLSAAATHYRMIKSSGRAEEFRHSIRKLSFTGEPVDSATQAFTETHFGVPLCSMYGTTEVGVCLVSYPGAPDFNVKPGSLGKPIPGLRVQVQAADGAECPPGKVGELKLWRRGAWFPTKDLGRIDGDGYFYHAGRADDVIISAGWTMSAVEIEDNLLKHPDVREAAVIGVADEGRGQVVKAFIVSPRAGDDAFTRELQDFVRTRLAQHEYPRRIAFVTELPKTQAGKVNRKILRDAEATA
ncbi:MAG: acyl-CoA synthetase [Acetobacteraceae bacterium]|nr:acyl-CoA synthetase [Acetobacteraceae bacterium]